MRIFRCKDHRRMPWKNGGGETAEIAVSPAGAGLDDFDWRISMAKVAAGGPFSTLPGVDRTLGILSGAGIVLSVAGMPDARLTGASEPFAFPGDALTVADLIDGPVVDVNVMTRRGVFDATMRRRDIAVPIDVGADDPVTVLLWDGDEGRIEAGGASDSLGRYDAVILGQGETVRLFPRTAGRVWGIGITGSGRA